MKSKLFIWMLVASSLFISCSEPIDESTDNELIGTEWHTSYADYIMVLKFISSDEVQGYFAQPDGTYYSGDIIGTYAINDKVVTFSDITFKWMYAYYKLEKGYLNGALLKTEGLYTFDIDDENWKEWEETWAQN